MVGVSRIHQSARGHTGCFQQPKMSKYHAGFECCVIKLVESYSTPSGNRQSDDELGMAGAALAFNRALLLLNETLGNAEPKARPALPSGNERIEHAVQDVPRNARTVIDDLNLYGQSPAVLEQRHLTYGACPQGDLPTLFWRGHHRLCGITRDV